jgi:hypothetical protein
MMSVTALAPNHRATNCPLCEIIRRLYSWYPAKIPQRDGEKGAFNINLRAHIEESVGAASSQNAPLPQTIGGVLVKSLLKYESVRSTSWLGRNLVWDVCHEPIIAAKSGERT